MSSWAKPGVKCVCVDGSPRDGGRYSALPVEGRVYTIASVEYCVWANGEGLGVHLAEVRRRPADLDGKVYPYHVSRFRPLITRTQSEDVALFRKLLETQGADA